MNTENHPTPLDEATCALLHAEEVYRMQMEVIAGEYDAALRQAAESGQLEEDESHPDAANLHSDEDPNEAAIQAAMNEPWYLEWMAACDRARPTQPPAPAATDYVSAA